MRPFGTVSPLFWIGKTGKKLRSDRDTQVIALYLMTNPHSHQTGVYHLPLLYLATEVGIGMDGALKALRTLEADGFCVYDEASEWVWVCEMAAWQIGESLKDTDKRAIGVQQYLESIPRLPFEGAFHARYHTDFHLVTTPKRRGLKGASEGASEGVTLIREGSEKDQSREGREHEGNHDALASSPSRVPPVGGERKEPPPPKVRATRIPEDFTLTPERRAIAEGEGIDPRRTFETFRDYWRARPGAGATKLDWDATWRNWCKREGERNPRPKGGADNGLPFAN